MNANTLFPAIPWKDSHGWHVLGAGNSGAIVASMSTEEEAIRAAHEINERNKEDGMKTIKAELSGYSMVIRDDCPYCGKAQDYSGLYSQNYTCLDCGWIAETGINDRNKEN